MSRQPSILNSLGQVPTAETLRVQHQISLIDREGPSPTSGSHTPRSQDAEPSDSDPALVPPPLVKKPTSSSLSLRQGVQRKLTERKYARYTQDNYDVDDTPAPPDEDPANQPQHGEPANALQTNYLERGRAKAKALLRRKKGTGRGKDAESTALDVLWENQRGIFFFGMPKYSASSLLPSDPKPWQNAQFRTSPVDIRNAQVPDPGWEWAWKSWYVDMSRDVDEEGWEYSLQFFGTSSWHGNHPFFHSFVRRRRWLRVRKRRVFLHHTREKAHELTADYFTIHPATLRADSEAPSRAPSQVLPSHPGLDEEPSVEKMEMADMGSLVRAMKVAALDRERLIAIRKFIREGGEELYYLADRMPELMSLFVYQSSRRQVLTDLLQNYGEAHERRESLKEHVHDNPEEQQQHDSAHRHANNLMRALEVADEQVTKLEYWSDIKSMAQRGETLAESDAGGSGWDPVRWAGITSPTGSHKEAFASKQAVSAGAPELHQHAEHATDASCSQEHGERIGNADSAGQRNSQWFNREINKDMTPIQPASRRGRPADDLKTAEDLDRSRKAAVSDLPKLERYTTAAESPSEISEKVAKANDKDKRSAGDDYLSVGHAHSSSAARSPRTKAVRLDEPIREQDSPEAADERVS